MTDTNGFYSLSGLYAGSTITFSKAGYQPKSVTINRNTRLDIQLVRR